MRNRLRVGVSRVDFAIEINGHFVHQNLQQAGVVHSFFALQDRGRVGARVGPAFNFKAFNRGKNRVGALRFLKVRDFLNVGGLSRIHHRARLEIALRALKGQFLRFIRRNAQVCGDRAGIGAQNVAANGLADLRLENFKERFVDSLLKSGLRVRPESQLSRN
jgi:hypothetical protein